MTHARLGVAAGLLTTVAASVALLATYTHAQPPGFGKGKFGFGKGPALKDREGERKEDPRKEAPDRRKEGERKEGERKETPRKEGERKDGAPKEIERKEGDRPEGERLPPAERIRQLERELIQTQTRMHQLVQELVQAHIELMHEQMGRGPMPPFGPVNPPFGRPGFGAPVFPGAPGVPGGRVAPPLPEGLRGFPPVERMTPEQIQELIQRLQKALEERKARQERREGDKPPRKETDGDKPPLRKEADKGKSAKAPEKLDGDDKTKEGLKKPADGGKDKETPQGVTDPTAERRELLERIEKLTRELEQLRRKLEQQK